MRREIERTYCTKASDVCFARMLNSFLTRPFVEACWTHHRYIISWHLFLLQSEGWIGRNDVYIFTVHRRTTMGFCKCCKIYLHKLKKKTTITDMCTAFLMILLNVLATRKRMLGQTETRPKSDPRSEISNALLALHRHAFRTIKCFGYCTRTRPEQ